MKELAARLEKTLDGNQAPQCVKIQNQHRRLAEALQGLHSLATTPNPMDSTGAHLMKVQKASQRLRDEVAKVKDESRELVASRKKDLEDSLKVVAGIKPNEYAPEIRSRFANLSQSEKLDVLQSIIDSKDGASFAAIVGAPPFLTGLDPALRDRLTDNFYEKVAPDFFVARNAMNEIDGLMDSTLRLVDRAAGGYTDPALTAKIEKDAIEANQAAETFAKAFESF
jgi:hypothetical protein